jgi:hypothetical protein
MAQFILSANQSVDAAIQPDPWVLSGKTADQQRALSSRLNIFTLAVFCEMTETRHSRLLIVLCDRLFEERDGPNYKTWQ